jgi:hypothetical protein
VHYQHYVFPISLLTFYNFLCTGNNRFFHLSVLEGNCIAEAKQELARLAMCPVSQQITRACVYGVYYRLFNECKLHLVKMGRHVCIYDDILAVGEAPIHQYEYEQMLLEMMVNLGFFTLVHGMLVPGQKHLARIMITYVPYSHR